MKERVKFVLEWENRWNEGEGSLNFAELCREFGISRQVGYEWVRRYQDARHSPSALKERSRRPHRSPSKVSDEVEELLVVAARKARPTWGPKKLRAWLSERYPKLEPGSLPRVRTWAAELTRRRDEVMVTLRDETVRVESVFLDAGEDGDWLVYYMRVDDADRAAVARSTLAIDAYHRDFMRAVVHSRKPLELLVDFDRSRE